MLLASIRNKEIACPLFFLISVILCNMSILKAVQGSFHQGNEKFGETAGMQCTCCSLFSIAFTLVKNPSCWDSKDLDFVVEKGDKTYKSLNVLQYLMIDWTGLLLVEPNYRLNQTVIDGTRILSVESDYYQWNQTIISGTGLSLVEPDYYRLNQTIIGWTGLL